MYSKLAVNNVRKSFKDYTVYFLTLTFAVCIFYTFNSVSAQSAMTPIHNGKSDVIKMVSEIISMISVFVSVILGLLIIYANNFLIKRRKKELGLYMSLGMGKNKISKLLIIEELIIGAFSLIAGLALGLLASQGLSVLTAKLFDISLKNYKFVIAPDAILKTIIYFGIIYILVMILNTIVISKYKLIDLLNAHKKNERIKIKNSFVAAFIFIAALVMLGVAYYLVNKVGINFTAIEFKISILLGIVGTAAFFYGLTTFLIMVIQKNKKIYLKKLNIFTLRQMNSKINTNFISMTVICLMLFLTISMLSVGVSFKNQNVDELSPVSLTARMYPEKSISFEDLLNKSGFKVQDGDRSVYFTEYETNVKLDSVLSKYVLGKESTSINDYTTVNAITISDYNKIREIEGKEKVDLNKDSVLVQSNSTFLTETINNFMKKNDGINLDGKKYKVQNKKAISESNITTHIADNTFTVIVPDNIVSSFKPYMNYLNINYGANNNDSSEKAYTKYFDEHKSFDIKKDATVLLNTRVINQQQMQLNVIVILYVTLYLGVIFLISSAAVLALQQLSEASDSADRYNALRRIGAPEKMINKSIFTQTFIYFALPLVLAVVHSIVGIYQANEFVSAFGNSSILTASLMTMIAIVLIYGGYFIATFFGYKNIVKKF